MSTTRTGMYEYKRCKSMSVRTASDQMFSALGIGNLYLGAMQEPPIGVVLEEVFHFSRLKERLLSLRAIDKAGSDLFGKNGLLGIGSGRFLLILKGSLNTCEAFHIPTDSVTRFFGDPPSQDLAAKEAIAPGSSHPSEIDANISKPRTHILTTDY